MGPRPFNILALPAIFAAAALLHPAWVVPHGHASGIQHAHRRGHTHAHEHTHGDLTHAHGHHHHDGEPHDEDPEDHHGVLGHVPGVAKLHRTARREVGDVRLAPPPAPPVVAIAELPGGAPVRRGKPPPSSVAPFRPASPIRTIVLRL